MTSELERERLSQKKMLARLSREIQATEMVTVYLSESNTTHNHWIYCALIPSGQIEKSLGFPTWDLAHGHGYPGAVQYYEGAEIVTRYFRFGDDTGVEPLLIDRNFHGIRSDYQEFCEEFRLFHSLYHDRTQEQFIKIDDDGNEHIVAVIQPDRAEVRLKEIRQFLAIKEMHLSIQFDCREHSVMALADLALEAEGGDHRDGQSCWGLHYGDLDGLGGCRAFSRLLGKRLIPPLPKDKSGFWGFAEEKAKKYADFIVGVNENGDEITYTSNPSELANYFGANPNSPHYLTAVSFRKEVLDKYYQQPGKYTVADGILRCGYLWSMSLDNHHENNVCAWLGDLGRDLPYQEQLHWRSHNFASSGGVSETYFRRQIMAEFTDSERPEHIFQERYAKLCEQCKEYLGWRLLLPLADGDQHHIQCVRVPATDEQRDFDDLVLGLTKVLIDSLNERELNNLIPGEKLSELKGSISRLEAALAARGAEGYEGHITFLRRLQNLRSSGSAHRKGSNYARIAAEFGVDNQNLRSVFRGILGRALDVLDYLIGVVRSRKLSDGATANTTKDRP